MVDVHVFIPILKFKVAFIHSAVLFIMMMGCHQAMLSSYETSTRPNKTFCEYVNDLHLRRELYLAGHSVHVLWHWNGYTNTSTLMNSVPFSSQMIIIYLSISIFEVHTIQIGKMPDQPPGQLSTSTSRHSWTLKYTYDLLRKKDQFQQLQIIEINQNIAFKGKTDYKYYFE